MGWSNRRMIPLKFEESNPITKSVYCMMLPIAAKYRSSRKFQKLSIRHLSFREGS
jgi:hypothetical protein